ncbi:hypothetical protein CALVIDRAFT_39379 [Calocera viscosa TUFC12733]|uniref:Uncharacterized protein n=1 Tax=Calocera viscosa (strain TUFC12733) TaxID=1330018 RepID=A0A167P0Z1_CALVF|nr:hypothetical protein CALVIDRAFT_39379 [Calocera viscosa TUFC12733]
MYMYERDETDDGGIPRDPKRVPRPTEPTPLTPGILWLLVSLLGICCIFLLYRRAGRLVTIAQPLKRLLRRREGRIRLSEDGPPAEVFVQDDEPEEEEREAERQ